VVGVESLHDVLVEVIHDIPRVVGLRVQKFGRVCGEVAHGTAKVPPQQRQQTLRRKVRRGHDPCIRKRVVLIHYCFSLNFFPSISNYALSEFTPQLITLLQNFIDTIKQLDMLFVRLCSG
jgi:hypothetical protein